MSFHSSSHDARDERAAQGRDGARAWLEPESDRYEYRHLTLPRGTTRGQARAVLTEQADTGRWELARVRLFVGGARQVSLRRRIIRVRRTT